MKKLFFSFLLLALANTLPAQDLIVTQDGDSINCKITKIKGDNIFFTFNHNNEIRNTLLPKSEVEAYQYGFYKTSAIAGLKAGRNNDFQRFRLAVNGGFSLQTAKIAKDVPADFKDYVRKLKRGAHFGADAAYFFSESLGAGVKYYLFKSSNSIDEIYLEDNDGNRTYGKMSDDVTISFIGPSFFTRTFNYDKTNAFMANLALGYMGYSNNSVLINPMKMTGSTVGVALDLGYDIGLSENLALGFQVSLLTGTLMQYKLNDGTTTQTVKLDQGEYESLNRIDFSVGLRFGK